MNAADKPVFNKRLSLTAKLFIAMVVVNILLIAGMAVGARISFERGFLGYLAEEDIKRLDDSTGPLTAAYREHGNWNFVIENHHLWHELMRPYGHAFQVFSDGERWTPPPLADMVGASLRFALLDPNGKYLTGNEKGTAASPRKPIVVDGKIVGWLMIVPIQNIAEAGDQRLETAERDASWTVAITAMVLAVAISLWLARAIASPLQRVARATHRLASGDFAVRVAEASGGELGQLEADFNHLAVTLDRNEKMRAALVADVSHELRTPLAVMQGEVEALEVGVRPMSADAMRSLSVELARLNRLVDDLYHLSLSDVGALPYYFGDVDVVEAMDDVLHLIRTRLDDAGIALSTAFPSTPCWINGDERRLQQVFSNIFQNVLRYVNKGARVHVRIQQDAKRVKIDIQDSGVGVPDASLEALFGRFYRVEASRSRATGGAGLGLPICRSIVEAHHGTIKAAKAPQGGLWIAIDLPLAPHLKEAP